MIRTLAIFLLAAFPLAASRSAGSTTEGKLLPRTILAVYNGSQYKDIHDTRIHRMLEMPLNHLGLIVRYHDIETGLPVPEEMRDVRGIVTWFRTDSMPHPVEFLHWGEGAIDSGMRFVVIGNLGVSKDEQGHQTPISEINRFLAKIGIEIENWTPVTYDQRVVYKDPALIGFERPLPAVLPPFDRVRIIDPQAHSHLTVRRNDEPATEGDLVVTGPHGGWVAAGLTHFASYSQDQLQWYVNPFEFLRLAFASDELPKLDTTTLSGRRIYYSQIDGDGWRNVTEVARYRSDKFSSAQVILKEAIEPFSDLPVTVGPIAGDLDPDWFGTEESLATARKILSLPWVEAGSHTYSHPLDWETLYQNPARVASVPNQTGIRGFSEWFDPARWTDLNRALERYSQPAADEGKTLKRGHSSLRSYTLFPFDPDKEIEGSISFLNRLLPPGKQVAIIQWSGTTLVPEVVLRAAQRAGVRNINGGDTRFDPEFNSYAWVAPLSRQVGALRQIYSSESNENTYTNEWNERYFGFRYLSETLRNTESPMRIKPFDIYFHMYSGEKQPGLDAVLGNLQYARTQELAPIHASEYSAIVEGFHSARIIETGHRHWRIENRDGLETVRFDHADSDWVDWASSSGVVGERHFQGSLYVALDSAVAAPVVALSPPGGPPAWSQPYLIESRWKVQKFCTTPGGFEFASSGFGAGEMEWAVAPDMAYNVSVRRASKEIAAIRAVADHHGTLRFTIAQSAIDPVEVQVVPARSGEMKPLHYVMLAIVLAGALAGSVLLIPNESELGLMYFRERQYGEARPLLEKRLKAGDRSIAVVMPLVELYVQSGDVNRAIGLLRQMTTPSADQLPLFQKVATLQKYNQQMQDYLHTLEIIEQIAGSPDGLRELIQQYRYTNDNAKLIPALQTLIARYKGDSAEYLELANLLAAGSRFAAAADVMERFEATDPAETSADSVEMFISALLDSRQGSHALTRAGAWVAQHHDSETMVRFAALLRSKGTPALEDKLLAPFDAAIDGDPLLLAEWMQEKYAAGNTGAAFERLCRLYSKRLLPTDLIEPFIDLALARNDVAVAVDAAERIGLKRLSPALSATIADRLLVAGKPAIAFRIAQDAGADFLNSHPLLCARLASARADRAETERCLKTAGHLGNLTDSDHLEIATIEVSLGHQTDAQEELDRIVLLSAPDDVRLEAARLYLTLGKARESLRRFDPIRGKSTGAGQAWALVAGSTDASKEVARWIQSAAAQSIPESLVRDLYYVAVDHKQPDLALAASQRLFSEHPDKANRLRLASALHTAGHDAAALVHARALLAGDEPQAEEIYTASLLGAIRNASGNDDRDLKKELRTFLSSKLSQANLAEQKQLELINGLLDLGAWKDALPKLETLARRRDDLVPLFIETAIRADDRKAAVEFLKTDLARGDLSRETRETLVYGLLEAGESAEALPWLCQLALAGLPNWINAYEEAAQKLGRNAELLDFWRKRLEDRAISADEKRGIAYKLIDAGKPEMARSIFGELARTAAPDDPDVAEWLFLSGTKPGLEVKEQLEARARTSRAGDQIGWLTRLLEADAPDRVIAVVAANGPGGAGSDSDALLDIYIRALSEKGATDSIASLVARRVSAITDRERVRKLATLARETAGLSAALPAYERLGALDVSDPEALHWLGVYAYGRARYSVAQPYLTALLASSEGAADDNYDLAEILWRDGKRAQARAYYGRALRLTERQADPPIETRAIHAHSLFRMGYMDRALREYRSLIADNSRDGDLRADFAAMLLEASQYDEAGEVLSAGVDSGAIRVGVLRAQLLSSTGHLPEAMEVVRNLGGGNTTLASVLAEFAGLEKNANRNLHAQDLLQRAALLDPGNEDYHDAITAIDKEYGGQLHAESEFRRIQGAQSEDIVRLRGEEAISRSLRVLVSVQQDRVMINNLLRKDGSLGAFDGVERQGEAALEWESENGTRLRGSLFSGKSSPGAGISYVRPDLHGSTTALVELARPDWDFGQSLAQGGTRDRAEVRRETRIGSRATAEAGVAVNRYNLPGISGADRSVSASGNFNVQPLRIPGVLLNYSFDGEYVVDSRVAQEEDGSVFRPLPVVSREVHSTGVQLDRQITRGLHVNGSGGMAFDRLGGNTPFVSGSVSYDRGHFDARIDYDRRSYKYDSSQIVTSLKAGIGWRF